MTRLRTAALGLALTAILTACSGTGSAGSSATAVPATTSPVASVATSESAAASPATATKVSANDANHDELVAALTAAGVPNAERWAREVEEYRPYDTADPTLQHLQDELAKYQPDPDTLARILSALQP